MAVPMKNNTSVMEANKVMFVAKTVSLDYLAARSNPNPAQL